MSERVSGNRHLLKVLTQSHRVLLRHLLLGFPKVQVVLDGLCPTLRRCQGNVHVQKIPSPTAIPAIELGIAQNGSRVSPRDRYPKRMLLGPTRLVTFLCRSWRASCQGLSDVSWSGASSGGRTSCHRKGSFGTSCVPSLAIVFPLDGCCPHH